MAALKIATIPVTPFDQNCTLLWDDETRQAVVVDPGGDNERVLAAIDEQALDVGAIWLTHGHLDHAGGAMDLRDSLRRRPGHEALPIVGPDRRDDMLLANLARQGEMFGMQGLRNVTPDTWLKEGDSVSVGPHVFDVLHCPGHTPGHVVFVNKAARFAQFGDVLFAGSVGRTDFPYGDHSALIASIKVKLLPLGDDMAFVCGHGPASTIGRERVGNPYIG